MTDYLSNPIFYAAFTLLTLFVKHYFIEEWISSKKEKNRKALWIQFLRNENMSVDESINQYELLKKSDGIIGFIIVSTFAISGLLVPTYVWNLTDEIFESCINLITINIYALFGSFVIYIIIDQLRKNKKNFLKNANVISSLYLGVIYFIVFSNFMIFLYHFSIYSSFSNSFVEWIDKNIAVYIVSYATLALTIQTWLFNKKSFTDSLKSEINMFYSISFPKIKVSSTKDPIEGVICNIFDENLLVLENNDEKTVIEWNSIMNLKVLKNKDINSELSDFD